MLLIHTMFYCIEYLLSLRADLNDPADTNAAHFIGISAASVNLNWPTAGRVSDLRASPDTELLIWDCLWRCRRLCSIMSWVSASSSPKSPLDVSKFMTLSWWMLIMRQISWEPGTAHVIKTVNNTTCKSKTEHEQINVLFSNPL